MRYLLIISLLISSVVPAFAKAKKTQVPPSFYLRAGLGYAMPVAGNETMNFGSNLQPVNGTQSYDGTYSTYNLKKASFGAGFGAVIAPGIMINDHIGVEVAAAFGLGMKKYTLSYTSTEPNRSFTDKFTSYAKLPIVIMPALVVSTGNSKPLSAYARGGLALSVSGKIITEERYADNNNGTQNNVFEIKNRFTIGMCGAVGGRYKLNNHMALWLEVNGMALSLSPKTGQYTSIIQDGQQIVNLVNTSDTHYVYESGFSERDNNSASQPTRTNSFSTSFSNMGLSFGLMVSL